MKTNVVYCGDCKDVIPEEIPPESIDLIYIDPPFFSGINYEKIWKNGAEDKAYQEYWKEGIHGFLRYMEGRLYLCKNVLKPTGSIYLHCDHHANAHLRILMDKIFGEKNFRDEIIWSYKGRATSKQKQFPRKHDVLLFYSKDKGKKMVFNPQYVPYRKEYINQFFKEVDEDNRVYRIRDGKGEKRQYLDVSKGDLVTDVWTDIKPVYAGHAEKDSYLTQKPEPLLERIILASSNPRDIVLDPMCGGGTTLVVAKNLEKSRRWIGIDVSPYACEKTLTSLKMSQDEMVIIPNCVSHLESMKPIVFQEWVVKRLDGQVSPNISADGGIDGWTSFERIPIQSKRSKNIGSQPIRQFLGDIQLKSDKKKGIFVALSFNEGAKKVIHEIYNKTGIEIELKTAEDLIR